MNAALFETMRSNFLAASEFDRRDMKSAFWQQHLDKKGDIFVDPGLWENFRTSAISEGLDNANALERQRHAQRDHARCLEMLRQLEPAIPAALRPLLEEIPVGGAQSFLTDGRHVSRSSIEFVWMLTRLLPYLENASVAVEIGGGYGGLARLVKSVFPSIRYIILDLPEASAIQTYYLNRAMPESRFLYAREIIPELELPVEADFDFMLVPGSIAERLPDKSIDIFINTRSMMEMDMPIIQYYFSHMERALIPEGRFYCINRYWKISRLSDYPFDACWYPSIWAPWPLYIDPMPHQEILAVRSRYPISHGVRELLNELPKHPKPKRFKKLLSRIGLRAKTAP